MKKKLLLCIFMFFVISCAIVFCACGGDNNQNDDGQNDGTSGGLATFTGITLNNSTFTYDGTEKSLGLIGTLPQGAEYQFTGNSGINAGEYNVSVIITCEGYNSLTLTAKIIIQKASYDMSNVLWDYTMPFTYDGMEKQVILSGLPQGVSVVSYMGNKATNAGNYTASVTLNYDTVNYNAPVVNNLAWVINKADYDMGNVLWDYTMPFTYDGMEKQVVLSGLPQGVSVESYISNKATNAGNYTASVTLNYDTVNYNEPVVNNLVWVINKADYDMSNAAWTYTNPFVYDGEEKTVLVTGLPRGVTVVGYTNNTATAVGNYTASVILNYDNTNYNAPVVNDLNWKIRADLSDIALEIVQKLMQVPDVWGYFPESFQLENKVFNGLLEFDFENSYVPVSSLPQVVIGKQMNVFYDFMEKVSVSWNAVKYVYGSLNAIVGFYQAFINDNPDNFAHYEKETSNFNFVIDLNDNGYSMSISYSGILISLGYTSSNQKCVGKITLTNAAVLKYEISENDLIVGYDLANVYIGIIDLTRQQDDSVYGKLFESLGIKSSRLDTLAIIEIDENFTRVTSSKRDLDDSDLTSDGDMEVYDNQTGNLICEEIKEKQSMLNFDTCWFNIWDVSGINSIKATNDQNGKNPNTIYINGNSNAIHTKGLTSRQFDIEMKNMYVIKYNSDEQKYEKVKISIPRLFVQKSYVSNFSTDFYDKNSTCGAINPTTITVSSTNLNYMYDKFPTSQELWSQMKSTVVTEQGYNELEEYFNS